MAAKIRDEVAGAEIELVGGGRGVFNVRVDGNEVWDKHSDGGFPNEDDLVARMTI